MTRMFTRLCLLAATAAAAAYAAFGPGATVATADAYARSDVDCSGYEGCQKTHCFVSGSELCEPTTCNAQYCS